MESLKVAFSENKGADQLRSYCEADLRLWFRIFRLFSHKASHMVIHRRAILALNLSFLNRLHLSKVVLKCAAMFEFRLSVLVNSYGYVGMLPPFYRTFIQH